MTYFKDLHGSHLLCLIKLGEAVRQAARPAPVARGEALVTLALRLRGYVQPDSLQAVLA